MPQPQANNISDAEWHVIKVLWDRGPLTAGQVVQAIAGSSHWRPRTIKTLLGRLVRKGAVRCDVVDKRYLYRAAVTRRDATRREARSFLARVFDGALVPAVATFIQESDLSAEELDELRRMLVASGSKSTRREKGARP
jgi:BlaI family penicillinase repressor